MDSSKHPDSKQLQSHYHHQQQPQDYATIATAVQQTPPYDQLSYYNYTYSDPSLQQHSHQYDASYYHNYYHSNFYHQQQQHTEGSGSGSLGLGFGQDPYVVDPVNSGYLGFNPAMMHYGQGHFRPPVFVSELYVESKP